MRYSRMTAKQPKKKRKYTNLIIVVLILGIAVYLIGAGAAGGWLAENVINPVFNNETTNAEEINTPDSSAQLSQPENATTTPIETIQSVNLPEASGTRIEQNITAHKIALYTLQTGAFSEENNAKQAASEIIAHGGAGFVAFDGEFYRVLIAGYLREEDAIEVKDTLEKDGVMTSVFMLESGTLEFKIGAEQSQIEAVKACFETVPESVNALQQIVFDYDKGVKVDADIADLQQKVDQVCANLEQVVTTDEGAIMSLNKYMKAFGKTINNIPNSSSVSKVELSSQLKYNLVNIVVEYSAFLDEISS